MPRISGRSGNVLTSPILRKPNARIVAFVLGMMPICERTCLTTNVAPLCALRVAFAATAFFAAAFLAGFATFLAVAMII